MQAATEQVDDETRDTLPPPAVPPEALRRATRVVVVEPSPLIRHFITRALTVTGYEVHAIATLAELEKVLAVRPELVLAELHLADGSGDSVCRRVRARLGAGVPVVLMSSGSREQLESRSARCGADRAFSKVKGLGVLLPLVHELALDVTRDDDEPR